MQSQQGVNVGSRLWSLDDDQRAELFAEMNRIVSLDNHGGLDLLSGASHGQHDASDAGLHITIVKVEDGIGVG